MDLLILMETILLCFRFCVNMQNCSRSGTSLAPSCCWCKERKKEKRHMWPFQPTGAIHGMRCLGLLNIWSSTWRPRQAKRANNNTPHSNREWCSFSVVPFLGLSGAGELHVGMFACLRSGRAGAEACEECRRGREKLLNRSETSKHVERLVGEGCCLSSPPGGWTPIWELTIVLRTFI